MASRWASNRAWRASARRSPAVAFTSAAAEGSRISPGSCQKNDAAPPGPVSSGRYGRVSPMRGPVGNPVTWRCDRSSTVSALMVPSDDRHWTAKSALMNSSYSTLPLSAITVGSGATASPSIRNKAMAPGKSPTPSALDATAPTEGSDAGISPNGSAAACAPTDPMAGFRFSAAVRCFQRPPPVGSPAAIRWIFQGRPSRTRTPFSRSMSGSRSAETGLSADRTSQVAELKTALNCVAVPSTRIRSGCPPVLTSRWIIRR